jgi:hypothetical protein
MPCTAQAAEKRPDAAVVAGSDSIERGRKTVQSLARPEAPEEHEPDPPRHLWPPERSSRMDGLSTIRFGSPSSYAAVEHVVFDRSTSACATDCRSRKSTELLGIRHYARLQMVSVGPWRRDEQVLRTRARCFASIRADACHS